ncbi:MAG: O-antigen ligase family protein [Parvibaculum sp.]|nr:O-antigen ligase family protein [Parvibaculum sp.]
MTPDRAKSNTKDGWLFWGLIALVALAPLPLASNRPLPAAILALCAGILLLIWSLHLAAGKRMAVAPTKIAWPLFLFGGVVLWIFIQWVPLPFTGKGDPIWTVASDALQTQLTPRLSVNPEATLTGLMRLLTYAIIFWLTLQTTRAPDRARQSIIAATMIGAIYALYGLVIFLLGNDWILIYPKWAYLEALTSTFVNRNSYATFAGLSLLCATAIALENMRQIARLDRPLRVKSVMLLELLVGESRWAISAVFLIAIALLLTASRAGVASSFAAIVLLTFLLLRGSNLRFITIVLLFALIGFFAALVYFLAGENLMIRAGRTDIWLSQISRQDIYDTTIAAIMASPWTGTGFGTYIDTISGYRDGAVPLKFTLDRAHNTYLESAAELGIPATIALNLSIGLLVLRMMSGYFERRRNRLYPAIGIAATLLVGLHSLVDFSLQIPAVTIFYAFILGVSVSQSWRHSG